MGAHGRDPLGGGPDRGRAGIPRPRRRPAVPLPPATQLRDVAAVQLVGGLLLLVLGVALVLGFITRGDVAMLLAAVASLTLGATGVARIVLRRLDLPRLPAPALRTVRGERATVVLPEPSARILELVLLAGLGGPALVGGLLLVRERPVAAAALLLVAALALWAAGRALAYATVALVALTPGAVEYRRRAVRSVVRWDDVTAVTAGHEPESVLVHARDVRHTGLRGRPLPDRSGYRRDALLMDTEDLGLDGRGVAAVLAHYASVPAARAGLGTPASLATIAVVAPPAPSLPAGPRRSRRTVR